MALFILLGEDDYSIEQELGGIKRGLGAPEMLATNTFTFEGQQLAPDELRNVCITLPFLAEKRLVIIDGLLGRFEDRRGNSRRRKKQAELGQVDEFTAFAGCINQVPESTVLVLIDGRVRSSNPLLSAISGGAKVKTFPVLRGERLQQWIKRRVTAEGGRIAPEAVEKLAELVGGDLWLMDNEVKKLVLYTSGRRIEVSDVGLVTSHSQEANVFAMVDAIFEFKPRVAEQRLFQLLQRGATPTYLMVMLARQIQLVIRAKELVSQRHTEVQIQTRLGLSSEFALRRTLAQATRFSLPRLKSIYHKLLETDLAIKTGKREAEPALTVLIAELCQR